MRDVLARAPTDALLDPDTKRRFLEDYERPASYAKRQVLFKTYTLARFLEMTGLS